MYERNAYEKVSLLRDTTPKKEVGKKGWHPLWYIFGVIAAVAILVISQRQFTVRRSLRHHSSGKVFQEESDYDEERVNRSKLLAYASYCNKTNIEHWDCKWCKSVEGFTPLEVIVYHDFKVYLGYDEEQDKLALVVAGGTDVKTALLWSWVPLVPYPKIKRAALRGSILDAWYDVDDQVMEAVERVVAEYGGDKDWYFTGYDWGGAVAQVAALNIIEYLENEGHTDNTYTATSFGTLRWCNAIMADFIAGKLAENWRVVNMRDFFAQFPPRDGKFGHFHSGNQVWYLCDDPSEYRICDGNEDSTCKTKNPFPNFDDHYFYMGNQFDYCKAEQETLELSDCITESDYAD